MAASEEESTMISRKVIFLLILLIFSGGILVAQNQVFDSTQDPAATYRLFRTNNIWTFIKLDTTSGRMWQVQYSIQDSNRGSVPLSLDDLAKDKKKVPGRFTLYSTQNIYNFILVDQIDGGIWQVQWSLQPENRGIVSIDE